MVACAGPVARQVDTQVSLRTCLLHESGALLRQAGGRPQPASGRPGFTHPLCGYRPWEAPESILADAGVELDGNYPNPIISLENSENHVGRQTVLLQFCWGMQLLFWGTLLNVAVLSSCTGQAWLLDACSALCCLSAEGKQGSIEMYPHLRGPAHSDWGQSVYCRQETLQRSSQGIKRYIACRAAMQVVHACSVIEQSLAWGHAAPKVPYRPASYAGLSNNAPTPSSGAAATGSQLR